MSAKVHILYYYWHFGLILQHTLRSFLRNHLVFTFLLYTFASVKRWLLRIWLVAALFCGFSDSLSWVRAQGSVSHSEGREECFQRHDGLVRSLMEERQRPLGEVLLKSNQTQRVNASRPARLLPTHGGKPGRSLFGYHANHSFNPSKYALLYLRQNTIRLWAGIASPRFYYVIALRRILC